MTPSMHQPSTLALHFVKLLPSGNPTLILLGDLPNASLLAALSERLMNPLHLGAEQVGHLSLGAGLPHLQMMGGEFCVNATRAAALLLGQLGRLNVTANNCWTGSLTVSGAVAPLDVFLCAQETRLSDAVKRMESLSLRSETDTATYSAVTANEAVCGMKFPLHGTEVQPLAVGASVVHLPGISHVLLDTSMYPLPDDAFTAAKEWRKRADMLQCEAAGVVWYTKSGKASYSIFPLVYVRATQSEHLETACGSASVALGIIHAQEHDSTACIRQPSGEDLQVFLSSRTLALKKEHSSNIFALIAGRVWKIAEGTTWIAPISDDLP